MSSRRYANKIYKTKKKHEPIRYFKNIPNFTTSSYENATYSTETDNLKKGKNSFRYSSRFSTSGPGAVQRSPGRDYEGTRITRKSKVLLDPIENKKISYTYIQEGNTSFEDEFGNICLRKKIPKSNYIYLESNARFTKDKGEEANTTYKSRKGTYTTIVRSPPFNPTPIILPRKAIKEVTQVQAGKNMQFYDSNTGYKEDRGTTQVKTKVSTIGYTQEEVRYSTLDPTSLRASRKLKYH